LSLWLTARYAAATRQVSQTEGAKGWRALREPCADVVELSRGDHSAERLRIEREHLAATRYRQQEERARELWAWSQQPKIREFLQRDDHDHTATLQALGKLMFGEPFMEWAQGVPESDAGQRGAEDAAGPAAVPGSSPGADSNQGESRGIKPGHWRGMVKSSHWLRRCGIARSLSDLEKWTSTSGSK
jgi:hypothetical protein